MYRGHKGGTYIDWEELVDGYNRMYDTSFGSEEEMYRTLYPKITLLALGNMLGVSKHTLYARFDLYGISRQRNRGGNNNSPGPKTKLLLAMDKSELAELTVIEIGKMLEISPSHCFLMLKRYGLPHLRKERDLKEKRYLAISDEVLAKMTKDQIIKECNASKSTFIRWQQKHKRRYHKLESGRKRRF
jgi:hypothetical protein